MADEPEEQRAGSPAWMMTYGDSITLLLTFFVMLLTFSTPNEEEFQRFSAGLLRGSKQAALFPGSPGQTALTEDAERLTESRIDQEGAEKPPQNSEDALDQLTKHYEEIDISQLPDLKGALLIKIPLVELFGTDTELGENGRNVLGHVVKMARARPYSIVVRARAGRGVPPEEQAQRSLGLATRVVQYLNSQVGRICPDIGISDNVQLGPSAVGQGVCEIIMLEV